MNLKDILGMDIWLFLLKLVICYNKTNQKMRLDNIQNNLRIAGRFLFKVNYKVVMKKIVRVWVVNNLKVLLMMMTMITHMK